MSASAPNLRDNLNSPILGQLSNTLSAMTMGDLFALLIAAMTPTETGISVTTNKATLANTPSAVFQVKTTAATSGGVKALKVGQIPGPGAIVPAPGECVWVPGTKTVLFNVADAVTACS